MKRLRFIILIGAIAAAMAVPVVAKATGGSGTQVTIQEHADYDFSGTRIDVGLNVRCTDSTGFGVLDVTVEQFPPETPYVVAVAFGPQQVVCDGHTHTVALTTTGPGFDAGRAQATADLTLPMNSSGNKTVVRWITIVAV